MWERKEIDCGGTLSEEQQEGIQSTINEAIECQLWIYITYYKTKRLHTLKGKMIKINPFKHK
ncbi:YolD-like family protein [Gracilibacillus marinus]|uniref:YolD-like family protein n=1 Tax=Gracilibacillus marinus TaxID=630535 RepID=A0ABV8VP29_9BACI